MSNGGRSTLTGGLSADVVLTTEAALDLAPQWRVLAEEASNAFVSPEWFLAWQQRYGQVDAPYVVVVRDDGGSLRGVMPFVKRRTGPFSVLRFAGGALGDRFEPACVPADRTPVAAAAAVALRERGRDWSAVVLDWVEDDEPWLDAFVRETRRGLARTRVRTTPLPYLDLSGLGWESYLASRSRNFRGQLGRRRRGLERDHEVVFHTVTDGAEIEARVETLFRLHESRWQGRGASSLAAERRRLFLGDFARLAHEAGWLRLVFVELDGKPVAGWYGWHIGERFAYFQAGLDPEYAGHSTGFVLLGHTLEKAFAEAAGEYDFLRGDEDYKLRFTDTTRQASTWFLAPRLHPVRGIVATLLLARGIARRLPASLRTPLERFTKRDGSSPE